jgi:hypothetical protein
VRHAKASSSASSMRQGSSLGSSLRGVFATSRSSCRRNGSGASAARRIASAFALSLACMAFTVSAAEAGTPNIGLEYGASLTRAKGGLASEERVTNWTIQIISDDDYEENVANSLPPFEGATVAASGTTPAIATVPISAHFTGLTPLTTYHVRAVAENVDGSSESQLPPFTTRDGTELPIADIGAATNVNAEHAYLHGSVNPNTDRTAYWFEWGLEDCATSACVSIPASQEGAAGEGTQLVKVTRPIGGLQPSTTYHYRFVAENTSGTVAGSDQTLETAESVSDQCPNEAHRQQTQATELPDCRAWELVSPPQKFGVDVGISTGRIRIAESESGALPMAATFSSLGGFADVQGFGVATEYMAQRTLEPGTNGWSTHAIFPQQDPQTILAATGCQDSLYTAISADLNQGILASYTPLTNAPNVTEVQNLYRRPDLRLPGAGTYQLYTDSTQPVPPTSMFGGCLQRPQIRDGSDDLSHIVFEQIRNLTANAVAGSEGKAYKSDEGVVRLLTAGSPTCPGGSTPTSPCSIPGSGPGEDAGPANPRRGHGVISADGSRADFAFPIKNRALQGRGGVASRVFQLDDRGTQGGSDDALIQLDTSEKATPDPTGKATFQIGSKTGNRIYFKAQEQLTDSELASPDATGLYLWERQSDPEVQKVSIAAEGGTFKLTGHTQATVGTGDITTGETNITNVVAGSFMPGESITGPGIPPATTIAAMGTFANAGQSFLTLSQAATETTASARLEADAAATTAALPFNATAAQVQAALESLTLPSPFEPIPVFGAGNVSVSGGPGGAGGGTPYTVSFVGGLNGVNVAALTVDSAALTGAGAGSTHETTNPIENLTLVGGDVNEAVGISDDARRIYFTSFTQLLPGGPDLGETRALFYWDGHTGPSGTLSYVAKGVHPANNRDSVGLYGIEGIPAAEVSPDGSELYFLTNHGESVTPEYEHGICQESVLIGELPCSEAYIYEADKSQPLEPAVVCASCDLSTPQAATYPDRGNVFPGFRSRGLGGAQANAYKPRSLSTDGNRAFFTSAIALVSEDTNGALDAYEYNVDTESIRLLSSGTSPDNSFYAGASADGDDAFILTRQRLSGWDFDNAYDMYDVRVGGAIPEPTPTPAACVGEACRASTTPNPEANAPGSSSFVGPQVDGVHRPKCAKKKRLVQRHGKSRCLPARRHQKKKRHAHDNRRVGR